MCVVLCLVACLRCFTNFTFHNVFLSGSCPRPQSRHGRQISTLKTNRTQMFRPFEQNSILLCETHHALFFSLIPDPIRLCITMVYLCNNGTKYQKGPIWMSFETHGTFSPHPERMNATSTHMPPRMCTSTLRDMIGSDRVNHPPPRVSETGYQRSWAPHLLTNAFPVGGMNAFPVDRHPQENRRRVHPAETILATTFVSAGVEAVRHRRDVPIPQTP